MTEIDFSEMEKELELEMEEKSPKHKPSNQPPMTTRPSTGQPARINEPFRPYTSPGVKSYEAQQLEEKARLFEERNKLYGSNYVRFGPIMSQIMATQNLDPTNPKDMARFGIFVQIVAKVSRYGENFNRGGHDDTLDDISVYAMMLKALDNDRAA